MFTSKGLFSDIVCPYQQSCMLPGCIFSHSQCEQDTPASTAVNKDGMIIGGDEKSNSQIQSQIESNLLQSKGNALEAERLEVAKLPQEATISSNTSEVRPKKVFVGAPLSPPPLRRKPLDNKSVPVSRLLPQATTKTPVKQPIKKEALNPRPLKAQPATFDIRLRLLKALHEQFVRLNSELVKDANDEEENLVLSAQELITKALDMEEDATKTPSIYGNVVKNKIMVYKRMTVPQWKEERSKAIEQAEAATKALISEKTPSKPKGPPIKVETGLSPDDELNLLHKLYTDISGLEKHGYVTKIPSPEDVEAARKGIEAAQGWENCDRCKTRFQVFPGRREEDGALQSGGTCTYHFGKPFWSDRNPLDPKAKREKRFRCCGQSMADSIGCTQSPNHVFKVSEVKRMATVLNFEKTPVNIEKISDRPVCIDGEMGYTVYGMELIRLTATSWPSGESLFDVLVRPFGEVLDLNSRYSGVWPKDMANALRYAASATGTPSSKSSPSPLRIVDSPAVARALLFSHLTPLTPLIGHGLENDLNAARIIHSTIIDTALLYPHPAGLPYRNSLKALMATHLNRDIQVVENGQMNGHDSKEDANAAGELVKLALAKEWAKMKRDGWTVEFGIFAAPLPNTPLAQVGRRERKRDRERMENEDKEIEINYG